ncbi:RemK protein [Mycobacterium riyadhense]|uniref:RemK protein n=1 Tax=Mycobacterium riyadhense TaxID=486698 RepID=A0A1X2D197_9MYCO|nr:isoprenylcysteine carboxylmethyltransferase family protein [Mycobacterium riyadhense]ORW81898.1 RemK protein [Mycobacterium riyadhense]
MTNARERQLWWRHLISFLIAPVTVTLVIPALIVASTGISARNLQSPATIALVTVGGLLIAVGLGLLVWTVALFDRVGDGTLGVGKVLGEPVRLVVRGPYRHVRNPMISGVLCILLGEAAITASGWLLLWFAVFFAVLATFIRFWEEPHLEGRYGREYVEYRRNVPAWIPRLSAWK